MERSEPRYLYKIAPSFPPVREPLPARLTPTELDRCSGFVHLSTAKQVPHVLRSFFDDQQLVYVLRIKYDTVIDYVCWESPDAKTVDSREEKELFPHLYNGLKLGKDEVESLSIWTRNPSGWDDVLHAAKPWLLY